MHEELVNFKSARVQLLQGQVSPPGLLDQVDHSLCVGGLISKVANHRVVREMHHPLARLIMISDAKLDLSKSTFGVNSLPYLDDIDSLKCTCKTLQLHLKIDSAKALMAVSYSQLVAKINLQPLQGPRRIRVKYLCNV